MDRPASSSSSKEDVTEGDIAQEKASTLEKQLNGIEKSMGKGRKKLDDTDRELDWIKDTSFVKQRDLKSKLEGLCRELSKSQAKMAEQELVGMIGIFERVFIFVEVKGWMKMSEQELIIYDRHKEL